MKKTKIDWGKESVDGLNRQVFKETSKVTKWKAVQITENELRSSIANTNNTDDFMFQLAGLYGRVLSIVNTKN